MPAAGPNPQTQQAIGRRSKP